MGYGTDPEADIIKAFLLRDYAKYNAMMQETPVQLVPELAEPTEGQRAAVQEMLAAAAIESTAEDTQALPVTPDTEEQTAPIVRQRPRHYGMTPRPLLPGKHRRT